MKETNEIKEITSKLNNLSITHLFQVYFIMFNKRNNLEKHQIINELLYPLEEENFKYLIDNDPKKLNIEYRKKRLNSVTFHGTKYGQVDKFKKILENTIGKNWEKKVLDVSKSLNIPNIKRLGVPGRQGTVIQLTHDNKKYAIKVTQKGVRCGDGATGGMGFLKQARMQEISFNHDVTCQVHAIYCGDKKEPSFMVMDVMGERLVDLYRNKEMSQKHQKQLWDLYKKLDEEVGIIHNDINPLNIMTDLDGNLKLIDFDRSKITEYKDIKKWGKYPNLRFAHLLSLRKYKISAKWFDDKYKKFKQNNYQV